MATHTELGKKGEELAKTYLIKNGFSILNKNWRYSYYEIDIIAIKDDLLHFIEVKLRSSSDFGNPEESVNKKKIKFLMQAAAEYLHLHPQYRDFRLDILSIVAKEKDEPEYYFIEDVYI